MAAFFVLRVGAVLLPLLAVLPASAEPSSAADSADAATRAAPASQQSDSSGNNSEDDGPLTTNPNPASYSAGPFGKLTVSGAASGIALTQNNTVPGDQSVRADISNLQVTLQTADSPVKFHVQTGVYAIPSLGASNASTISTTIDRNFGAVPLAYGTVDIGNGFSVLGGQLLSAFGGEATFTYENMNIVRGLLFNQSNSICRGVQVNFEKDKLTAAASVNDGFYSGRITWFLGAVGYKLNDDSSVNFSAGTNFAPSERSTLAAPLLQNNSSMYNLGYSYQSGPWTLTPFIQYTHVARNLSIGIPETAATYGGAFLAKYAFTKTFALAGRIEYIGQSGNPDSGTVALLYGPGSKAYALTITPMWQIGGIFARAEYSYVRTIAAAPGLTFGPDGDKRTQSRFAVETGILF